MGTYFAPTRRCPLCGRYDCPGAYYVGSFPRKWSNGILVPSLNWLKR